MRIRFKPTPAQRAALRAQLARLEQPESALEILGPTLRPDLQPTGATCSLQSAHADRFVLRVLVQTQTGQERAYALKVYADDFGALVWAHSGALAARLQPNHDGPCLPTRYVPSERALVFPWVCGPFSGAARATVRVGSHPAGARGRLARLLPGRLPERDAPGIPT